MSTKQKRFILPEDEIPKYWYNIQADMKTKPMPPLNPKTKEALKPEDLYPIFAKELCKQELNQTDAWIEIPEAVREMYKYYRSTPLVRAYGLEKALGTPAHIYFKNESVSPIGSHKLNSALAQAYYCKEEGVTNVTTETGAGQWGAALSYTLPADTSTGYNLCAFGIRDIGSFCYKPCSDIAADAFISLKSQHCIQDKNITVASFIKEVISRQVQSAKFRQN